MFIKWSKRTRNDAYHGAWILHTAVLVESHRANGKPRQRTIGYLASMREMPLTRREEGHVLDDPVAEELQNRIRCWLDVSQRLNKLGLEGISREKILSSLSKRVPRPTAQDIELVVIYKKKVAEYFGSFMWEGEDAFRQKIAAALSEPPV